METRMRKITASVLAVSAAIAIAAAPAGVRAQDNSAQPKGGTLKGAAVGGAAGHMMGGHTKSGAAVGAMAGHHRKAKSEKQMNQGQ
jgi:outer membrane lipoprotein SlyB